MIDNMKTTGIETDQKGARTPSGTRAPVHELLGAIPQRSGAVESALTCFCVLEGIKALAEVSRALARLAEAECENSAGGRRSEPPVAECRPDSPTRPSCADRDVPIAATGSVDDDGATSALVNDVDADCGNAGIDDAGADEPIPVDATIWEDPLPIELETEEDIERLVVGLRLDRDDLKRQEARATRTRQAVMAVLRGRGCCTGRNFKVWVDRQYREQGLDLDRIEAEHPEWNIARYRKPPLPVDRVLCEVAPRLLARARRERGS